MPGCQDIAAFLRSYSTSTTSQHCSMRSPVEPYFTRCCLRPPHVDLSVHKSMMIEYSIRGMYR